MDRVLFLLPLLCVGVVSSQPIMDCQRLFSIVVSRAQHLHLLAQSLLSEYVEEQMEEQRQVNKIYPQNCPTDSIISPINKHEAQSSSVLKLLSVSYHLLEFWELSSVVMPGASRTGIPLKLSELKEGVRLLFKQANQGAAEVLSEGSPARLAAYRTSNAEMLACFKKDMHKLETYLTVGRCRLSPEANCTL